MNTSIIVTHITKELVDYKNNQPKFVPFDIISKGILVNALMKYYVPQEFRIFHTNGTKVNGEIHIDPLLKHNKAYKIKFEVKEYSIEVKLMSDNSNTNKDSFTKRYDRAMKGI